MAIGEYVVVVGFFLKEVVAAGINKLGLGVGFVFGEDQDIDGNRGAKNKLGANAMTVST
ncbi:MAG: hypothetical protein R2932_37545 [Caldilineaceae bacterium]